MTFASTARTETTGAKTGRRILVVDDNKDFVEALGCCWNSTGIR